MRSKYQEIISILEERFNFENQRKVTFPFFKIERTQLLMSLLNNPHKNDSFKIHVAGTNGKGSVCSNIETIFKSQGISTGMLTSPHLHDYTERIRINCNDISERDFIETYRYIESNIESHEKKHGSTFTFFEIITAMAFVIFNKNKVKVQIIETGIGGTFDSTNVIHSDLSVITPISYDHQSVLGNSIKSIAENKAGIIKKGGKTILSNQSKSAYRVIEKKARALKNEIRKVEWEVISKPTLKKSKMTAKIKLDNEIFEINTNSIGAHQIDNLATAIKTVREYPSEKINKSIIEQGIRKNRWPLRGQLITLQLKKSKRVLFIDGSHNEAGFINLNNTINKYFPGKHNFIIGMNIGHRITSIKKLLVNSAKNIVISQSKHPKSMSTKSIQKSLSNCNLLLSLSTSIEDALRISIEQSENNDIIICTGSLFAVAEISLEVRKQYGYK